MSHFVVLQYGFFGLKHCTKGWDLAHLFLLRIYTKYKDSICLPLTLLDNDIIIRTMGFKEIKDNNNCRYRDWAIFCEYELTIIYRGAYYNIQKLIKLKYWEKEIKEL